MIACDEIKNLIEQQIPDSQATVTSQDNIHFEAVVISKTFIGMSLVKRQQQVYNAIGEYIKDGSIHALALKTLVPE